LRVGLTPRAEALARMNFSKERQRRPPGFAGMVLYMALALGDGSVMYITSLVFLENFSARRSLRGVMIFLVLFLSRKKEQTICFEMKTEKRRFAGLSFIRANDAAISLPFLILLET
jgi:hypothetical protein